MLRLNRTAAQIAQAVGVRGATDITGFGLLGHAAEMASASHVDLRISAGHVPLLPGAARYAAEGVWAGGMWRNRHHVLGSDTGRNGPLATVSEDVPDNLIGLLCDPQTSGGLLLAVPAAALERFTALCASRGQAVWEIGSAAAPAVAGQCRMEVLP
jgi:selenide,water dikinase